MDGQKKTTILYRRMVQTVPDVFYEIDDKGIFTFVSEAARIFGYEPDLLIGKSFSSILHCNDVKRVSRELILPHFKGKATGDTLAPKLFNERRTKKRMTRNMEARIIAGDSKKKERDIFYVEVHSSGVWAKEKETGKKVFTGTLGIFRDITHRKFFEKDLADKCKNIFSIIEKNPDGMVVVNSKNEVLFVNPAAEKLYKRKASDFIGKLFEAPIDTKNTVEMEIEQPSGNRLIVGAIAIEIMWEGEKCYLVSLRDETENYNVREMFCEVSMRDEGTKLYNRRAFMALANQQIKMSKRKGENVYIIFADVDKLKNINDIYGHAEGDKVLAEVADCLRAVFRESDIISRLSGDEFAVMGVVAKKEDVEITKNRLKTHLALINGEKKNKYKISLSMGDVCVVSEEKTTVDELLRQADKKMYQEKHGKRL